MLPAIDLEIIATKEIIDQAQTKLGRLKSLKDDCTVLASFVERIKGNLDVLSSEAIASLKTSIVTLLDGDNNPPTDPDNGPDGDGTNSDPDNDPDGGDDTPPRGDNDGNGDVGGEVEQPYNPMQVAQDSPEIMTNLEDEFLADPEETTEDIGFTATPEQQPYAELARLSDRVVYFRRHDATPLTAYAGFSAKARAEAWGRWLVTFSIAQGFEVRSPKHLTDHKHELKLWGLSLPQVQALSESDLSRTPGTWTAHRFGAVRRELTPTANSGAVEAGIEPDPSWMTFKAIA